MSFVFVVDQERRPLDPVHPGRARFLLGAGHAAVLRRYPFTLIVKDSRPNDPIYPLRLKLDPGSKTTGIAVVTEPHPPASMGAEVAAGVSIPSAATGQVVWAAELEHRGQLVTKHLDQRRACRRSRRARHTRYRECRYDNRRRAEGWLPPSLESRIANVLTWVQRVQRFCPIGALSLELVKFDTQLLQNAEISGLAYQQGELAGYEVRGYLLEKWERRCVYCSRANCPLQVEHIVPTSRGGSDRVSNLTLACQVCNQKKGNQTAAEFGHPQVQEQAKQPLRDAAAVNATHWALFRRLQGQGLPLETGTGGRTKWNRTRRGLPKTHWVDAACVGASTPEQLILAGIAPLQIRRAQGRHSRQMCRTNGIGFPDKAPKATSVVGGFRTGDMVRAVVPASSTKAGTYVGRIAIRATGSCDLKTASGKVEGIHFRYCQPLHRGDGYAYQAAQTGETLPPPWLKPRVCAPSFDESTSFGNHQPAVVVVTGIMAAGKSTVARLLAQRFARGVHVEADALQQMIVSGGVWVGEPGDPGGEAARQLHLRLKNMCLLGRSFFAASFSVVLDDIIMGDRWHELQEELDGLPYSLVVLAPSIDVVAEQRDLKRSKAPQGRDWAAYLDQALRATMAGYGIWIDNSQQTPEETVEEILRRAGLPI